MASCDLLRRENLIRCNFVFVFSTSIRVSNFDVVLHAMLEGLGYLDGMLGPLPG